MENLSSFISCHRTVEKIISIILNTLFRIGCLFSVMMAWQIIQCQGTSDFLILFDNFWVQYSFLGHSIFQFFQYYYSEVPLFFLVASCFRFFDVVLFFLSLIYLFQISEDSYFRARQQWWLVQLSFALMTTLVMIFFVFLALNSKTTAKGFDYLVQGAITYGLLNLGLLVMNFIGIKSFSLEVK